MLKSLEIRNFRALEHVTVKKLGRVNLIVGKNNSGKSSILEALRIYAGAAQRELLAEIAATHDEMPFGSDADLDFSDPSPFEGFFPGRVFPSDGARIEIGEIGNPKASLRIRHARRVAQSIVMKGADGNPITGISWREINESDTETWASGEVESCLLVSKGGRDELVVRLSAPHPARRSDPGQNLLPSAMVSTRFASFDELADIWDKVGLTPNKSIVADALRVIEPAFQDLLFVNGLIRNPMGTRRAGRTAIVSLENVERPVPINSMGDGMARVLQLILKVFPAKGGFLLIDEFENGLHYSVQEKVWQMMFELAEKLDFQLFATTHSWDCIESFAKVASRREAGDGTLFRVGRSIRTSDQGRITATVFDGQQLFDLTQADMEVR